VLKLTVAFNYGARGEIARAVRRKAEEVRSGAIDPDEIDADRIGGYLDTADIPDPDLLIRTSGEMRLSNFLLWQLAYAELYFTDAYWPDFSKETLARAIADYAGRERRFGGLQARSNA
jgi:undecaprenyl diphosphate synthase